MKNQKRKTKPVKSISRISPRGSKTMRWMAPRLKNEVKNLGIKPVKKPKKGK